jgi:multidrug resistance efflux pump
MIVRSWLSVLLGPRHTWTKLAALGAIAALAFVFLVKGPYRVECSSRLEAVNRQIVPAPFDGYLRETMARAGDQAVAGQTILARLDDTELRLRLAEARAEAATHLKELAVARQESKAAEAQIAEAQAAKVQARIDLLQHQLAQSVLVAPISGIILVGDLERALGSPVQTGQTLFEIAPPEKLRVDLSVPESQIGDIAVGQRGAFASLALPGSYVPFTVERIDPIAQVVDQDNVFRVRARLDASSDWMRPGIEGLSRVEIDRRPYANIWSRRLVNWIRMKLWI